MNQFKRAAEFYAPNMSAILAEKKNEWGIAAYGWDEVGIYMTPIESAIWECIREVDAVFYPQFPVGRFFADFANPVAKIAIECDGREFHKDRTKDDERDKEFNEMGWLVYRIPGNLCMGLYNEETGEEAFATRFIRAISERHDLIRGNRRKRGFNEEMMAYLEYALEGKLPYLGLMP